MLTSGVAVFMLSTSPFEFVIRHFCWLLLVVLCIGACNSLLVFPILLSMIGPEAELVPLEHPDRISTPSPLPVRSSKRSGKSYVVQGSRSSRGCKNSHHHHHKDANDPSLTTITEEPQSWKSSNSSIQMANDWNAPNCNGYQPAPRESRQSAYAVPPPAYHKATAPPLTPPTPPPAFQPAYPPELQSIVVQPEVTVETTHSDSNTTKVTATANIKVELVTPGRAMRSYNFTS